MPAFLEPAALSHHVRVDTNTRHPVSLSDRNGAVYARLIGNILSQLLVHSKQPQQLCLSLGRGILMVASTLRGKSLMPSDETMWPI